MVSAAATRLYSVYDYWKAKGEICDISDVPGAQPNGAPAPTKRWMVTASPAILQSLEDPHLISDRIKIFEGKVEQELGGNIQSFDEDKKKGLQEIKTILSNMVINIDGDDHTILRKQYIKAFTRCFTPEYNSSLRCLLAEEAVRLINVAREQHGGRIDILKHFARPLVLYLNLTLLGVDQDQKQLFESSLAKVANMLPGNIGFQKEHLGEGMAGARLLKDLFLDVIQKRREAQKNKDISDDLLSAFVSLGGHLEPLNPSQTSGKDLKKVGACFLVVRSTEGAANLVGNGIFALLLHSQQLQKLKEDPRLIGSAVNEILRFNSPVEFIPRLAAKATRIAGQNIGAGDVVILNTGVANRFNDRISDPESLNIMRKNSLVFGFGLHECLGQNLARLVGEVAINTLLQETGSLKLVHPEKLCWTQSLEHPDGLRGLKELPLDVSP